jgi:trimeric autotransporter adhesin
MLSHLQVGMLRALAAVIFFAAPVAAQCAGWDARFDYHPGLDDFAYSSAVFDDGTGPALYLGGDFTQVGGTRVSHLARWDGIHWSSVGGGVDGTVYALFAFDDGSGPALYVGGQFANAGRSTPAAGIAKWNGASWSALGSGVSGGGFFAGTLVGALTSFDDGSGLALYVGGVFDHAGGIAANNIAKWNGTSWSPLGIGLSYQDTYQIALAVYDDGTGPALYAGGGFTEADDLYTNYIARWNGSAWSAVGTGVDSVVTSLAVHDDGSGPALFIGGGFANAGGSPAGRVAKWNGSSYSAVGIGMSSGVSSLKVYDDGSGPALYAGGEFEQVDFMDASNIAKWNGSSWSAVGGGVNHGVLTLSVFNAGHGPRLIAGGYLTTAGTAAADFVASWNGTNWSGLGTHGGLGLDNAVRSLLAFDDGHGSALYASGDFTHCGETACNSVARWNGSYWTPLGDGLQTFANFGSSVTALSAYDDGHGPALYAAGNFTQSGPSFVTTVAKWDGANWLPLGNGVVDGIQAMTVFDDGTGPQLYAGGPFITAGSALASRIARWNGTAWSGVGAGIDMTSSNASVDAFAAYDSGSGAELYAGGVFQSAGGVSASNIARWNGTSWSPAASGTSDQVAALAVFDNGAGPSLYVGGSFLLANGITVNHIARWDGRDWSPLGPGVDDAVTALCVWDDGSGPALVACGSFTHAGALAVNRIAKWNGTSWFAIDSGVTSSRSDSVNALAAFDDGSGGHADLYVGGSFHSAGGKASVNIAQFHDCTPGAPFCFGDGTLAVACPCANFGAIGHGCENSASTGGAVLRSIGSTHPDTLVLTASGELSSVLSIFLQGDAKIGSGIAFGDGVRCAGGNLKRLFVKSSASGDSTAPGPGDPSVSARSAELGDPIPMGSTRYYQTYYRDPNLAFCPAPQGDAWNVTNGVQVAW